MRRDGTLATTERSKGSGLNGTTDAPISAKPRLFSRLLSAALVCMGVAFVVYTLTPQTVGETARRHVLKVFQEHYPEHVVSLRRGYFDKNIGFIFEDLRILDPLAAIGETQSSELVRIERLIVEADLDTGKLGSGGLPLSTHRILLDGVHVNTRLLQDGTPSIRELLPMPEFGPVAPRMEIRRLRLHLVDSESKSRPMIAAFPEVLVVRAVNAEGKTDDSITLRGSTDFANSLVVQVNTSSQGVDIRGVVKGAYLSRDLFDRLPPQWRKAVREVRDLQCICDTSFALHKPSTGKLDYKLKTTIHEGRFSHQSIPQPISQLRGIVICDPTGVAIQTSQFMFGDSLVRASGRINGHAWPCAADLKINAGNIMLDDRLAAALPAKMQANWHKFSPHGRVDIEGKLVHEDLQWKLDGQVTCKGVDVQYNRFPYPVENLFGKVEIRDGIAVAERLGGTIGSNQMQCAFKLPVKPGLTLEKAFAITTDGPIPIDATLLKSMSPRDGPTSKLEAFTRSLKPRGSLHLVTALFTTDASGRSSRNIDVRVSDGYVRYEKFRYPLYKVTGNLQVKDDVVTLDDLRGLSANGHDVVCRGFYRIAGKPQLSVGAVDSGGLQRATVNTVAMPSHLKLQFDATNVLMDDALRNSLPEDARRIWDSISPTGSLDQLTANIEQVGSGGKLNLELGARQFETDLVTSRTLSLRPSSLPYRIDVTAGSVFYDGSKVELISLKGRHDASMLSANGICRQNAQGRWELTLNLHTGSRLLPDVELIAAMPAQMREGMKALQLRGPIGVSGAMRISLPDAMHANPELDWDIALQLEGNRIAEVGPVHSMRGSIRVMGRQDERGIFANGDIQIDSMHVYDLQVTNIEGPFSVANTTLYLGEAVRGIPSAPAVAAAISQNSTSPENELKGNLFGGTIDMSGKVQLSTGDFDVVVSVNDALVPNILADFGQNGTDMSGKLQGRTRLFGKLGNVSMLRGKGWSLVRDATLYKLPLMDQVMELLRIKKPDEQDYSALTDAELQFELFGETITFDQINVSGELIALKGYGKLDNRQELDVSFQTQVNPRNSLVGLLTLGEQYTLWTIDVRGPLHDLTYQRRALEGVEETLEMIFPAISDDQQEIAKEPKTGFGKWLPF